MQDFESLDDEQSTDEPAVMGIDRRNFVKLAVAAAATSGLTLKAVAQEARGGRGGTPAPPPIPLGQGEPPAWTFQAYPGGTGALLEKLAKERGRSAFDRAKFEV